MCPGWVPNWRILTSSITASSSQAPEITITKRRTSSQLPSLDQGRGVILRAWRSSRISLAPVLTMVTMRGCKQLLQSTVSDLPRDLVNPNFMKSRLVLAITWLELSQVKKAPSSPWLASLTLNHIVKSKTPSLVLIITTLIRARRSRKTQLGPLERMFEETSRPKRWMPSRPLPDSMTLTTLRPKTKLPDGEWVQNSAHQSLWKATTSFLEPVLINYHRDFQRALRFRCTLN